MRKSAALQNDTARLFADTPRHLILPLELEKGLDQRFYQLFLKATCILLAGAFVWASIAPIQELAVAPGQIIPTSQLRVVQHLEGGVIQAINVKEGDVVDENQIIARIEPSAAASELGQLRSRERALTLQKKRLEALAQGKKFDPVAEGFGDTAQINAFEATGQFRKEEQKTLETRMAQRKAELDAAQQEMASFNRQVNIFKEQLKIREQLFAQGFSSKKALLESQSQLETAKVQHVTSGGKVASAKQAYAEAEQQMTSVRAGAKKDDSNDISKIEGDLSEVQQLILKVQDRYERLDIRAPVKGIVQIFAPKSIGEVVKPGDVVAKIVPLDSEMIAEVQVQPDHIGQIHVGSKADVKLATFDFSIYGVIKAEVKHISASTFQNEKGDVYYKVVLSLSRAYVGPEDRKYGITPGMTVTAEIITGAKSVMRYLLKPIYKSLGYSFSER